MATTNFNIGDVEKQMDDLSTNVTNYINTGDFTASTITDFAKAFCRVLNSSSLMGTNAVSVMAKWIGTGTFVGTAVKSGNYIIFNVACDTIVVSGSFNMTSEATYINNINDQIGTVNSKFVIRNSNTITKAISSGEKGTINTSYSTSAPSGYKLINRAFVRTDDGGYSIIVVPSLGANYVVYESTGSAPTLTGYVADIWMKE